VLVDLDLSTLAGPDFTVDVDRSPPSDLDQHAR
jgi:hypothetical protein